MKEKLRELILKGARGHTFMPTDSIVKYLIANNVTIQTEAHWIPSKKCTCHTWEKISYVDGYECSECGRFEEEKEPYCNCGCKMTEVIL